MSHVLVISGFHLGVIFGLLFGFANLTLRRSYYFAQFHYLTHFSSFVALAGTTLYLLYATPQPPIVRAYCALVLTVFLATSTRRLFALRTMLTAALVVSWIWPGALLTVGPQLSFAAVGGIVFSLYLFRGASSLVNYFIVCVGAWTATAPVVLYHFGELQLLAPLFNAVFAVPLCVILVVGGGAAALLMQVSRSLGGLLFVVCEAAVSNILALLLYCQAFAEQTLFIVQNEKPQAALIATLVAILASGFVYVLFGGRGQEDRLLSHE